MTESAEIALPKIPPEIQRLLGKPALIQGENPEHYWEAVGLLASVLKPKDVIDWLWIKDVADENWDGLRVRRFKAPLIDLERKRALAVILRKIMDDTRPDWAHKVELYSSQWFTDPAIREEVTKILSQYGLDAESITAQSFLLSEPGLEAIDERLAFNAARRNAALREINLRYQPRSSESGSETPPADTKDAPPIQSEMKR